MKPRGIIDPGHGGTDPGASGNGLIEKDYNLKISLYQYERFKALGVPFDITRMDDVTLDEGPRTTKVKNSGAQYCISNHINAAATKTAAGAETIHSIYSDGKLANAIMDELVKEGLPKRRVFKKESVKYPGSDWYYMHRDTGAVETIIVEYDFLTNPEGAKRVADNWKRYAEAVVRAVTIFLGYKYTAPGETTQEEIETPQKDTKEITRLQLKVVDLENLLQRANAEKVVAQRETEEVKKELKKYEGYFKLQKQLAGGI